MQNNFENKKILILGFAREGLSSLRFLLRNKIKLENIFIADQKLLNQFEPEYKKYLKKFSKKQLNLGKGYLKNLDKFDLVIKTAGIKLNQKNITTNLNIFLENIQGKIIGITGTKGKSTTASLIYQIFKAAKKEVILVGNIGKPFLDYLSQDSQDTIYVAELSSHQLDTLPRLNSNLEGSSLDVGVLTSFYPEHLTYHGNLKNYWQAKMKLVENSKIIIINKKIICQRKIPLRKKNKIIPYGTTRIKSSLLGRHNQENIGAAVTVAKLFKVRKNIIEQAIKKFKPLEHRLEYVGKFKNIHFYNDVLSTTPESTIEAIDTLKNLETIIIGGLNRGLDYKKLAKKIVQAKIKNVIYWPNTGELVVRHIKSLAKRQDAALPQLHMVKNMRQTVKAAYRYTSPNSTVLLSPAASSYDFYKNYIDKGEEYKKLIRD